MSKEAEDDVNGFYAFPVSSELLAAIEKLGFTEPTPIQEAVIGHALAGRDIIGRARTGSGKTLAFGIPVVQRLGEGGKAPRALIMAPTRELALQVTTEIKQLTKAHKILTVYGGTPYPPQMKALKKGVSIVVGTPGRLRDLLERGAMRLDEVEIVVLDEADEMLRMGWSEDVDLLLDSTSPDRQVMLFSASMPGPMRKIADKHLTNPVEVQVESESLTVSHIEQRWMRVPNSHKADVLQRVLMADTQQTALVFAKTRISCAQITDSLRAGGVAADMLHGGLPQPMREQIIGRFRDGAIRVLVATDVAARGIDVEHITTVINYDLPEIALRYVHRIGRTARAGRKGLAITLVTPKQKRRLHELARALKTEIKQVEIPSDSAIHRKQRDKLRKRLRKAARVDLAHARVLVNELVAVDGGTADDVAAAAVHILAEVLGLDLDRNAGDKLPDWVRPVCKSWTDPHPDSDINETTLCLMVGKKAKVRPQAIVAALTKDAGVPAGVIGRIRVEPDRTYIGLPAAVADQLLDEHGALHLKGKMEPLSRATSAKL